MAQDVMNADYNGHTTPRGRSNGLWNNPAHPCPWNRIRDEGIGISFWDDFTTGADVAYMYDVTNATAGTFAIIDDAIGVADADSASSSNEQGVNVQRCHADGIGETYKPAAGKHIWFEGRLSVGDIGTDTAPEFFFGLATIDTTVIAGGVNTTDNHIGFETTTGAEEVSVYGEKATERSTAASATSLVYPHTLIDFDTTPTTAWVKFGFYVNGVTSVKFFVNGIHIVAEDLATANIPIVEMVPTLVCQSFGTVDPIVHLDWWAAAQLTQVSP